MKRPFSADYVFSQPCGTGISELFPEIHEQGLSVVMFSMKWCVAMSVDGLPIHQLSRVLVVESTVSFLPNNVRLVIIAVTKYGPDDTARLQKGHDRFWAVVKSISGTHLCQQIR